MAEILERNLIKWLPFFGKIARKYKIPEPPLESIKTQPALSIQYHDILCEDGFVLKATTFAPPLPEAKIVLAGATGVPQAFYRRFATFAAQKGFSVTTFDYRGIGQSKSSSLRGFAGDFITWARLDLKAAVDHVADHDPVHIVGHSFGGHAYGLLPNIEKTRGLYCFAMTSGWSGWMSPLERVRVELLWNFFGPLLVATTGYLAWSHLGMGEDLPKGVFDQWKRWTRYRHYFFDDPTEQETVKSFAYVTQPIKAVNALDDAWGPPQSRNAFIKGYTRAKIETADLEPKDYGLRAIGHMGYFRKGSDALWEETIAWLKTH